MCKNFSAKNYNFVSVNRKGVVKMSYCKKKCISLFLTEDCNLDCKYCYCKSDRKKSKPMDMEFIKCAIDDFYKQYGTIYLRFFADGEPTLELDVIKKSIEYAREKDENSIFELQTNGFFNEQVCKWLGENIDIIWISFDGTSDIQDYYRPALNGKKSSPVVERNIRYLTGIEGIKVGVRITVGNKNMFRQKEIVDYLDDMGVKYVYTCVLFADTSNTYYEGDISRMDYAKETAKAVKYAESKGIFLGSTFTVNFDEPANISCRACLPAPHLTLDGYISCCDMIYSSRENGELIYAKYDKENNKIIYDEEKMKTIRSRTVENLPECADCEIKYYCAGGCLGESLIEKGSIFKVKTECCDAIKYLAKELGVNRGTYPIFHP